MFEEKRKKLIGKLKSSGYIHSPGVINAFQSIPRENFVPEKYRDYSYSDTPLKIGEDQTISAPHMVGMMLELLELKAGETVLEVGGGSGYHAALAAYMVGERGHVYSIEYIKNLADTAVRNIESVGLADRITIINGDGSKGLPEKSPFDKITVACGAPDVPKPLVEQLKPDGIMVLPVGSGYYQELVRIIKRGGDIIQENHGGCAFVPMRGEHGI